MLLPLQLNCKQQVLSGPERRGGAFQRDHQDFFRFSDEGYAPPLSSTMRIRSAGILLPSGYSHRQIWTVGRSRSVQEIDCAEMVLISPNADAQAMHHSNLEAGRLLHERKHYVNGA